MRFGIIGVAALCVVAAVFASIWNLANSISTRADTKDLATVLARLAPDDPQTRYAAGVVFDRTLEPADADRSLEEFKAAAANSPNNFLLWLALAKARGRQGDTDGELAAAEQALKLAPNYASVHWAFGNVLFRRGDDGAMQYIKRAAETDKQFRVPAVDLLMLRSNGDVESVRAGLGGSAAILAAICQNLVRAQKFDEAQSLWESIDLEERHHTLAEQANSMAAAAMNARRYGFALLLYKDGGQLAGSVGSIHDGGFESGVKIRSAGAFEWQIADGSEPQIAVSNSTRRSGDNSLLFQFNTMESSAFRRVAQTVAVEPGSSMIFTAFYRSELKTASTLRFVVADAASGAVLGTTENFAAIADWKPVSVKFSVPAGSDGIIVSLARADCPSSVCPISGRVWIDDISLNK